MSAVAPPTTAMFRHMPSMQSTLTVPAGLGSHYAQTPPAPLSGARSVQVPAVTPVTEPIRTGRTFSPQRQRTNGATTVTQPPSVTVATAPRGTLHLYGSYMRVPSRSPAPPLATARGMSTVTCEPAARRVPSVDHALAACRSQELLRVPTPTRNFFPQGAQPTSTMPTMRHIQSTGTLPTSVVRQPSLPPRGMASSPLPFTSGARSVTVPPKTPAFASYGSCHSGRGHANGDISFGPGHHGAPAPSPSPSTPPLNSTISRSIADMHSWQSKVAELESKVEESKREKADTIEYYEQKVAKHEGMLEAMNRKDSEGSQALEEAQRKLAAKEAENEELIAERDRLMRDKKQLERKLEDIERQNSMVVEENFMTKSTISSLQRETDRFKREIREAVQKKDEAMNEVANLKQHCVSLSHKAKQADDVEQEVHQLNNLCHQQNQELDMMRKEWQEMMTENQRLESLLRQERSTNVASPGEWLYTQRVRHQDDLQVQLASSRLEVNDRKHQIASLANQLADLGPTD
mmetsp:Transcript_67296/g.161329  ORF Transcript_67296/g.161329 Transcript_67296/m.161329 type:complete len:519 (-) Transcript_67296:118-1674(-)|eukprot:CAMPEP_0178439942 /NCGR_PEP_ID=MMETSP0689_2-20121128/36468_1 /TAXON_ID=160604 /ORGANISM="Amphidinium massartii, Strain CS-259" /LENGTH=518 /DNA_ID=CAMNT_0020062591 /DNA_START=56 /DNA_END=1612 /DNA_ORIENTATION=-